MKLKNVSYKHSTATLHLVESRGKRARQKQISTCWCSSSLFKDESWTSRSKKVEWLTSSLKISTRQNWRKTKLRIENKRIKKYWWIVLWFRDPRPRDYLVPDNPAPELKFRAEPPTGLYLDFRCSSVFLNTGPVNLEALQSHSFF